MTHKKPLNSSPGSEGSFSNPDETLEEKKTRRRLFLEKILAQGIHFDLSNDEIEAIFDNKNEWEPPTFPPHP